MPQKPSNLKRATFESLSPSTKPFEVHFNPLSLVFTVENATTQQSGDPKKRQYVGQFSGKLTMDLQFDTTDTGDDVRKDAAKIARFMQPSGGADAKGPDGAPAKAQPELRFKWGSYLFDGTMDSFKEAIDFFSEEGIPLRALVSISLSGKSTVFDDEQADKDDPKPTGSLVPTASGDSVLDAATRGGVPSAARQLAKDNGLENLRFTGGAPLEVGGGPQLKGPAGFAAGAPRGGGGGFGVSVSVGGRGALFGGTASAGISASAGAFAGLESGRAALSSVARLDPLQMLPATVGTDLSVHSEASFDLGGAANNLGSAGLSADVGVRFSFRDRLTFDNDD